MGTESYHSEVDSISTSQFKLFCESPAEYEATFLTKTIPPKASSRQMNNGTVVHAVLLEKRAIDDLVRAYPTTCLNRNGGLIGARADEFAQKIHPVIPMKDEEIEQIQRICDSAMKSPLGEILRSGAKFEQRLDGVVEGVRCRCKPDIHTVLEGVPIIWDLKTTERISPSDWWMTAKQMRYSIQDALYSLIAEAVYGTEVSTFRFWAIETVKLLRVQPYWYDDASRETAKKYVREKLIEFAERKAANNWSDAWDTTGVVSPWDLGQGDGEMVEWEDEYDEPGQGQ